MRPLEDLDDLARRRGGELAASADPACASAGRGSPASRSRTRTASRTSLRAPDAEPAADVVERAVDRERGRRQHRRLHPIEQQLADDRGDVDRGGAQEHAAAADLEVVDEARVVGAEQERKILPQLCGPPAERRAHPRGRPAPARPSPRAPRARRRAPRLRRRPCAICGRADPDPALRAADARHVEPHHLQRGEERRARDRAARSAAVLQRRRRRSRSGICCEPTARSHVAREIVDAVVADRDPEILGGDVLELVRLVDDRVAARRE